MADLEKKFALFPTLKSTCFISENDSHKDMLHFSFFCLCRIVHVIRFGQIEFPIFLINLSRS